MHYPELPPPLPRPEGRYNFDTLDWIAAVFVIATPLFIAYQLIRN